MTPSEWADTFSPAEQRATAAVALRIAVENYLGARDPALPNLRTADLAEALWPAQFAVGDLTTRRKRMIDVLLKLARTDLADFCTRAEKPIGQFMGRPRFPYYWHAPKVRQ